MRKLLLAILPLLLTACVRDSATYYTDSGRNHTLSLRRDQEYFWNDNVRLTLVAARIPECQRQIPLGEMLKDEVDIDVFAAPDNRWSLRWDSQVWQVETETCTLIGEKGPVNGDKVGHFKVDEGKLVFEPAVAAAPAPAQAAAAAAQPSADPAVPAAAGAQAAVPAAGPATPTAAAPPAN